MWVDHCFWLVNILFSYFGPLCLELMLSPPPRAYWVWGALWTPCPSHGIFQAGAVCMGYHLICVPSAVPRQLFWRPQ